MNHLFTISALSRLRALLIVLPLTAAILAAENEPLPEKYQTLPSREHYAQARAVVLENTITLDYTDPAQIVSRERLVVKILDQRGVEAWGFIRRKYDTDAEILRIVSCRTIGADGKVIALPPNAANIVSADEAFETPEYGNYQELVITPLGLAPGAVIELELERVRDRDTDDGIAGERVWQGADPCLRQALIVRVPRGHTILRRRSSKIIKEKFTNGRSLTQWEWRVDSLPGIAPETDRPDDAALSPRLLFSDRMDWHKAAAGFVLDFLPQAADTENLSPLAATITSGESSVDGRVHKIASYLNEKIRTVDIRFGEDGYRATKPEKVAANRYADDKDRAALFAALLAACGIKAHPVLCWDGDEELVKEVPDLARLNRILLAVERDSGLWYIDPANDDRRPAFLGACAGRKGLLVKSAKDISWIDLPPASAGESSLRFDGRLTPGKKSWRAAGTVVLRGRYDQRWRSSRKELSPQERESRLDRYFEGWSKQAAVMSFSAPDENDLAAPSDLALDCELKGFAQEQGAMTIIRIPDQPFPGLNLLPRIESDTRRLPLVTDGPLVKELRWRIGLPKGWRPAGLPDSLSLDNETGSLMIRATANDTAVLFASKIELKLATVPATKYAQLKELVDAYSAPARWHLLLIKGK